MAMGSRSRNSMSVIRTWTWNGAEVSLLSTSRIKGTFQGHKQHLTPSESTSSSSHTTCTDSILVLGSSATSVGMQERVPSRRYESR